ncbi:hypothetical protein EDD22DRAFT_212063 [Suillus occidentalis]|nr:hypothetical protein EDD22DRAFT_212063 [Suillus occidentalis]
MMTDIARLWDTGSCHQLFTRCIAKKFSMRHRVRVSGPGDGRYFAYDDKITLWMAKATQQESRVQSPSLTCLELTLQSLSQGSGGKMSTRQLFQSLQTYHSSAGRSCYLDLFSTWQLQTHSPFSTPRTSKSVHCTATRPQTQSLCLVTLVRSL